MNADEPRIWTLRQYKKENGESPFRIWLSGIGEPLKDRIQARLLRVGHGNLGDHKFLGGGVYELRMNFGPGIRVYFGLEKQTVVLLLCGGDKSTQWRDIAKAKEYWQSYLRENLDEQKK